MVEKGGFQFKEWNKVGDPSISVVAPVDTNRILGVIWNKSDDTIRFNVNLNFSEKVAGKFVEESISLVNFDEKFPKLLPRRKCFKGYFVG